MPLSLSLEQLRLISYGPRRDIIAVLANNPDLSAREIAARLGRKVTSLYRHLDLLADAGLILQSGSRPGARRAETLFALAAPTYAVTASTFDETSGARVAFGQAANRYASAASRRLSRAIDNGTARLGEGDGNVAVYNVDLQLDGAALIEFHKQLRAFVASARALRVRDGEQLEQITLTILAAPTR